MQICKDIKKGNVQIIILEIGLIIFACSYDNNTNNHSFLEHLNWKELFFLMAFWKFIYVLVSSLLNALIWIVFCEQTHVVSKTSIKNFLLVYETGIFNERHSMKTRVGLKGVELKSIDLGSLSLLLFLSLKF